MHKLSILFPAMLGLLLSACTGPQGPMGPQGPAGEDGATDGWRTDEYTVYSSDWALYGAADEPGSYYYYVLEDEYLTDWIFDIGLVSVYVFSEDNDRGWVQRQLPVVQPMYEGGEFTQIVDYDIAYDYDRNIGTVALYVTYSDFKTSVRPLDMTFRIVKEWWTEN